MGHWLVKSEPGSWSWDDQVKAGTTDWSGVRNPQAIKPGNRMPTLGLSDDDRAAIAAYLEQLK